MLEGTAGIVTGASAGIGRATATELAAAGVSLAIGARSAEDLETLAEDLEATHDVAVEAIPVDVRDPAAVEAFVTAAVERFDGLDLVVHNAGTGIQGEVATTDDAAFRRIIETNVAGSFYVTRAALPALRQSEGTIVFVGSSAGQHPFPINPVYAGTKGWVRQFAHSLEAREGDAGVGISVVNPGAVRTDFAFGDGQRQRDRYEHGEALEPETVAAAIRFACAQPTPATVHELDLYPRDQLSPQ